MKKDPLGRDLSPRNVTVPKYLHRALSHIALDHDDSVSNIFCTLGELFLRANQNVKPDEPLNYHDLRVLPEEKK